MGSCPRKTVHFGQIESVKPRCSLESRCSSKLGGSVGGKISGIAGMRGKEKKNGIFGKEIDTGGGHGAPRRAFGA